MAGEVPDTEARSEGEASMGKISQFSGRCHTEISFMVGEQPFRAVMVKERKGSHHGQDSADRTEEVVIRLWMGEAGVVVQSLQQAGHQPAFSCSGEGISDAEVVEFGLVWMRETRRCGGGGKWGKVHRAGRTGGGADCSGACPHPRSVLPQHLHIPQWGHVTCLSFALPQLVPGSGS